MEAAFNPAGGYPFGVREQGIKGALKYVSWLLYRLSKIERGVFVIDEFESPYYGFDARVSIGVISRPIVSDLKWSGSLVREELPTGPISYPPVAPADLLLIKTRAPYVGTQPPTRYLGTVAQLRAWLKSTATKLEEKRDMAAMSNVQDLAGFICRERSAGRSDADIEQELLLLGITSNQIVEAKQLALQCPTPALKKGFPVKGVLIGLATFASVFGLVYVIKRAR